jgi:hypothetical protein
MFEFSFGTNDECVRLNFLLRWPTLKETEHGDEIFAQLSLRVLLWIFSPREFLISQ